MLQWMQSGLRRLFAIKAGDSYRRIIRYTLPELVTAFILSSFLNCVDAYFISFLGSASKVATVTVTSMLIQFMIKVAEGLSVGTVILVGYYNGRRCYQSVGAVFASSLWTTACIGATLALVLMYSAYALCLFFHIPDNMYDMTVSYLQIRAIGVFFLFLLFVIIGFLRGIKNTRVPMYLYILGSGIFVIADYLCIFGGCGIPAYGLYGSAIAFTLQYVVMLSAGVVYIYTKPGLSLYRLHFFPRHLFSVAHDIVRLSWPVMLDKAALSGAKMWLVRLIAPLGTVALASFGVIKDVIQLAFVPASACAQVITFLVSNDYGNGRWHAIAAHVKKLLWLAIGAVACTLTVMTFFPHQAIQLFDKNATFTPFATSTLPYISILVLFDVAQLILAAALRGAAQVRLVMKTRIYTGLIFFLPLSLVCSWLAIANTHVQFILIYGSFYCANGLMSVFYLWKVSRFQDNAMLQPARYARDYHGAYYPSRSTEVGRDVSDLRE